MTKLKGLTKLNKALKNAFSEFEIEKFTMNGDWAYYPDTNKITYSLVENNIEDIWFNEFVKKRFGYKVKNTFMITILHEIGHKMTLDDIYESDAVYEFCEAEKERIDKDMKNAKSEKECKKLEFQYFALPDEIIATKWAVDYMRENEEKLAEIWEKLKAAFVEFYSKNIDKND